MAGMMVAAGVGAVAEPTGFRSYIVLSWLIVPQPGDVAGGRSYTR